MARQENIDLKPGEAVKIIVGGAYLSGEIVRRSRTDPRKWLVRTYFHDSPKYFDDLMILSDRREQLYRKKFRRGTLVRVKDRKRVGIVVGAAVTHYGDSFLYIPVVLVGSEKKLIYPESLQTRF